MQEHEKNPYVILGVDYGCSLDEARKGFVRVVRRLRSETDSEFTEEEVTSALHSLEQVIREPESAVDVYRIPSDPTAYALADDGLFAATPRPLRRQSPRLSSDEAARIVNDVGVKRLKTLSARLQNVQAVRRNPYEGV